jgi:hypothetical protein
MNKFKPGDIVYLDIEKAKAEEDISRWSFHNTTKFPVGRVVRYLENVKSTDKNDIALIWLNDDRGKVTRMYPSKYLELLDDEDLIAIVTLGMIGDV